ILLPSQNLVKSGTFQSNITDGSRGIFNVFEFDVHEIPDGTYELALEIGGAEIHHECKFEIYIVTSELEQLMDHVIKVGTRTRSELARLEKMLSHLQNVPSSLDTELLRRLLYLRQRITCFFETIDNMLQWHVPRPEDIDVICAAGTSIVFHAMKDVRKFHDEVIARSLGIPGFTIPREWNFGETASQQFLTLLATLTSDLGTEIHWEVVGDVSLGGLLGIREKKERDYLLSIYSNGIPVLSAGIILHSKASIDRVRQKIGTEQPASMSAKGSIFKNKEALIVVKDETTHGFKAGTGRIIVDTMEISISATSSEGIKKVAGCILDGRLIDMHAVNALAEITLDTGSSDLGLLQELEATSKDLSFDQYTRSVAAQLENGSMSWAVADFHSHSAASDGVFKPQDVAIFAACAGIDIYGLSDHHSIAPSMFLANLAHQKHWRLAIIPGCQEVTHIYFHAISLGATATVIESVPVDKIPNEVQKTGAFLNFAHTRLPHPWPTQQMALGSASSFQSFDFSERIIHDNWTAWNNDARIPVLTESTGTDIGTFGSRSRTIAFFPSKSRDTLLDSDDLPRLLVEALKHDECIALAGQVLFGKLKNIILAQAIIRAKKGPIKEKYEKKKLAKFLSLI
nr:hypothetical protein [Candidatus Sigynarchaeota archaeon]